MSESQTLFLIDGHALAYRTYFALTTSGFQGTSSYGEPTAAVFGFTSVLLRLLEKEQPDYLAVSFDVGKTFRDEMFPDYKATREKMPDDLRPQIKRIQEVVDSFNIPIFVKEGYEADDVLGSLSRIAVKHNVHVVIVTGDRDLLQLVNDNVSVSLPGKSLSDAKLYTPRDVAFKFGVTPDQFVDYKALVGDKSDNIPGVAGVGDKTAKKLLQQYMTLENIYTNLENVEPRFRNKLTKGRENAFLSKKLASIVTDIDLEFDLDACAIPSSNNFDMANVQRLFLELEFRSHLKRVNSLLGKSEELSSDSDKQMSLLFRESFDVTTSVEEDNNTDYEIINTQKALNEFLKNVSKDATIAFDTETTSTSVMQADLVGISLSVENGKACYIPVGHDQSKAPDGQLELHKVIDLLSVLFSDQSIKKVAHNAKYDYIVLKKLGLIVNSIVCDTMISEWLLDPNSRNKSLKNLTLARLGLELQDIGELIGKGKNQNTMDMVPVKKAAPYAAADADMTLRLYPQLYEELVKNNSISLLELELSLIPVLSEMEMNGVLLDTDYLSELSETLNNNIQVLKTTVKEIVGYDFNLNSTQQLSTALFDHIGLSPPRGTRRTASGHYSTAAGVLNNLQDSHEVIRKILEYRELTKLKSTYVDALPKTVNNQTGRVHTSFNQTGTVTGRLASSNPNLQNIPIRSEIGRRVRKAFIAPEGCQLVAMDYSQIELRIAAHLSCDEFLTNAFKQDVDIHASTAAAVFDIPIDKVSSDQRRQAKAVNFGLLYGMGPYRLASSIDITVGEAEDFIEKYFDRLPGVKQYLDKILDQATTQGFVETLLGRRRYFPMLKSNDTGNKAVHARAEREAINAPIQGAAADIIKIAMVEVYRALKTTFSDVKILLQVHDELLFECPNDKVEELIDTVRPIMESAYDLSVPLKVDVNVGKNWEEMIPFNNQV